MQQRVHLLASLALSSVVLLACNQEKKEASPEPAATTPATATTTATEDPDKAGAAQPTTAEKTDKTGATNPEKDPAGGGGVKTPTATVAKGEKSVTGDGKDLNLKNESGKGSVQSTPGGTKVTGKSGKSITVPGL
jgi:hypothetical protein